MNEKIRYESIDLLRGLAIITMIEVHVFNAFLAAGLREQSWFHILNFINGLVAPSFLFVSGFAFYISVSNKADDLRKFGDVFYKRIKRIVEILVIGYCLHIPFYSLSDFINQINYIGWIKLSNVDVLHSIAAGLFVLLLLRLIIKNNQYFISTVLVITLAITLLSPFIWQIEFTDYLPMPIANYFNQKNGSLFPIFPWMGFIFSGAFISKFFIDAKTISEQVILIKKILVIGFGLIIIGHILLSGILPEPFKSVLPNPIFFVLRVGYVLALLSICWFVSQRKSLNLKFIYDASRESLLIYWLHLQFIYLKIFSGKNLEDTVNHSFGIVESVISSGVLILFMIFAAKGWGNLKLKSLKSARMITYTLVLILVIIFIIR